MGAPTGRRVARPRIRRRLRLIALGLVLLPVLALAALVRGIVEVERQASEQFHRERQTALLDSTEELAGWMGDSVGLFPARAREPYQLREAVPEHEFSEVVVIDGSCSDWRTASGVGSRPCEDAQVLYDRAAFLAEAVESYDPAAFSFSVLTGTGDRAGYLYLYVRVFDDDHTFRRQDLDEADHLRVIVENRRKGTAAVPARFVVVPERGAEGALTTYQVERGWRQEVRGRDRLPWGEYQRPPYQRPFGVWRTTTDGYEVELRLPLLMLGSGWRDTKIGLAVVDVDGSPAGPIRNAIWVVPQTPGTFAVSAREAGSFEREWLERIQKRRLGPHAVFDARGRELFSSFGPVGLDETPLGAEASQLLDELVQGTAHSGSKPTSRIAAARITGDRGQLLGFVLQQDVAPPWRPRIAGIVRESPLTATILAGALLLLFVVLAYAGRLSQRILALMGDVGAERDANDEIGELSRRLWDLIERDRAHRDYLEQLPRILGHETLGPLSVVKMAIDDLANRDPARRAVASIEELIEDLREATSLEDALEKGERVELDLVGLVRETACAYRDANHAALEIDLPDQSFRTVVIERRIEQLLEKLLDNAVDFSDENPVRISVECAEDEARIRVENTGSQLPEGPALDQLFAPMRSDRKRTSERHLGLGLYVARVIAEQHGGSIRAWNADGGRVVFEVTIRRAD